MTSAPLQNWFYVSLTMKAYADGASVTYKLVNRAVIDDSASLFTDYIPILKNISGVGCRMGEYLPYASSGSITLDNSPDSIGYERRFSDLLDRYTIIEQDVSIYVAQTQYDDLDVTADFALAYKAKVKDWRINPQDKTLQINIAGTQINADFVGVTIDPADFSAAPSSAYGKNIPVVFGASQEVPTVRTTADGSATPWYAYACDYHTTFTSSGIQAYYTKGSTGSWDQVKSASAVATEVWSYTAGASTLTFTDTLAAWFLLHDVSTYNYIVTQVALELHGQSSGGLTIDGTVELGLWEGIANDVNQGPGRKVATATANAADFQTDSRGAANVWEYFVFDKPIPLTSSNGYWLSVKYTPNVATGYIQWRGGTTAGAGVITKGFAPGYATDAWDVANIGASAIINFKFYGLRLQDGFTGSTNNEGFRVRYMQTSQKTALSGYSNPDISKLEYILSVSGLQDDSGGTLTGAATTLLTQPKHVIGLLSRTWNGSAWVAGGLNLSTFSSSLNSNVTVRGASNGRPTIENILGDICKNTASRIALINDATSPLALWQYGGTTATTSAVITDEDAQINSVEQRGIESIVNRINIFYDRRYRELDLTLGSAQGQFRNYASTLNWYSSLNYLTSWYSATSVTTYGTRPLAAASYDWFADSTSAEFIGKFLLANGAIAHTYVELEVTYFKFRTLECLQIVEILHPDLPAYFGTSANAKLPTYSGTDVDPIGGHYWKRAQRYRAQIEAKELIFNPSGTTRLRLTCRLLLNSPKELT